MATNTPKQMSSRLATMKFMQRSANKNASPSPSTPNGPPSKKVRLSNGASTPGTPTTPDVPQSAENKRREEALARAAERSGETHWVLSYKDLPKASTPTMQVQHAGFAVLDAEDDSEEEEEQKPVRMQFGGGVKKKQVVRWESNSYEGSKCTDERQKPATPAWSEESDEDSDSEEDESDDFSSDDPTAELIRETRREAAAKERSAKMTTQETRRPNIVDEDALPGGLSSLSGGGRAGGGGKSNVECFNCHQKGHMSRDCPKNAPRGTAGRGRGGSKGGRGRR